jgi:hypothetical protein
LQGLFAPKPQNAQLRIIWASWLTRQQNHKKTKGVFVPKPKVFLDGKSCLLVAADMF